MKMKELEEQRRLRVWKSLRDQKQRRIPFERVASRLWEINDEKRARWSYLQGLGFVQYLAREHGAFRLRLLLESARRERSVTRAFERTYGKSLEDLEKAWWAEVLR